MTHAPDTILLAHGGGGRMARSLISDIILKHFSNPLLDSLSDAAVLPAPPGRLAMTTDSFVVRPLFFPGGDIGRLAVCGTVNDLAVAGARPVALSCGLIIEEGLPVAHLEKILLSMKSVLDELGVPVVTGDTKVVERGAADGLFINTTGLGVMHDPAPPGVAAVQPGDRILVNGTVGDHGMAVMACRQGLEFESPVTSDCAPLYSLVRALLEAAPDTRFLRDATRGGLAAVLHEACENQPWGISLEETALPVNPATASLCDLLGLDPLHVANEGKLAAIIPADQAGAALHAVRAHALGRHAALIGAVTPEHPGRVSLHTRIRGDRLVHNPSGEQLPRIC